MWDELVCPFCRISLIFTLNNFMLVYLFSSCVFTVLFFRVLYWKMLQKDPVDRCRQHLQLWVDKLMQILKFLMCGVQLGG